MARIAIFGLGPGGIFAMLQALEEGHTVDVFEKRTEFKRTNALLLSEDTRKIFKLYHQKFVEWVATHSEYQNLLTINQKIYSTHRHPEATLEIGQLQSYFFNLLPMLKDYHPGKLQIHGRLPHYDDGLLFKTVTPDGNITLEDPQTLKQQILNADHIIIAEGGRREIAKALGFRFEKTDFSLYRFWVKCIITDTYIGRFSDIESQAKATEMGFNREICPKIFNNSFYLALQVPSWIMFLPSQRQRSAAIKQWITHVTFDNYDEDFDPEFDEGLKDKKPLTAEQVEITDHPLFIVEHTQPVNLQVIRRVSDTSEAYVIGDTNESTYFPDAYGADHAIKRGQNCIHYITEGNKEKFDLLNKTLHNENISHFNSGSSDKKICLVSPECKAKWSSLLQKVTSEPFELEVNPNNSLTITCSSHHFKTKLSLFIRFILKTHANGFKEDFFQSLLDVKDTDKAITINHANEIIELLDLYVNLQKEREGFHAVSLNELEIELEHLQQQFQTFLQQKKSILYPEMTAEELFDYLQQNNQLALIDIIGIAEDIEPSLIGMTAFIKEGDLCSIYDVINHHFEDLPFFSALKTRKDAWPIFSKTDYSMFKDKGKALTESPVTFSLCAHPK